MDINHLQAWSDYWRSKPLLFPTAHVARHFMECRLELMERQEIAIKTSRGVIVDAKALDQKLIELLKSSEHLGVAA